MARKNIDVTRPLFAPEPPAPCATCESGGDATHSISIYVKRGTDYSHQRDLYSVTYSVCGSCAKKLVTVTLGAELRVR